MRVTVEYFGPAREAAGVSRSHGRKSALTLLRLQLFGALKRRFGSTELHSAQPSSAARSSSLDGSPRNANTANPSELNTTATMYDVR